MTTCPLCKADVPVDSNFCQVCKAEMPTMKIFVHDQLFELVKMENERRLHSDSKANTYIGLLSIAITLFGALGGLLTIEKITFFRTLSFSSVLFIYILYILIISAFVTAVIYAFKAYHIGSPLIDDSKNNNIEVLLKSGEMYIKIDHKLVLDLLNVRSTTTRDDLIEQLDCVMDINSKLNIYKSNNIIKAFRFTMVAIGLLLAMTLYISGITLSILR